jgi:thiol-disulfide isomerase/thioredoxin
VLNVRIAVALASLLIACTTPTPPPARDEGPLVRFVPAGEGDVPALAQAFAREARAEGRAPLVYVGATWCEPCRYFHAAAENGELDPELPRLALLEFDRDRDGARLDAAGYSSRMIPLFVVPGDDGRATSRRIEGSIHGPGSPAEITPRLRAMIEP